MRTFAATAGQKLTLTVSGNTYPQVDLTVRDPNGVSVASLFSSTPTAFRDVFTLPVTGTYTITVDPPDQDTGHSRSCCDRCPTNGDDRDRHRDERCRRPTIGENAVRTFPATAGQKLTLTVSDNTYPQVDLTVRDPNGVSVASSFSSTPTAFRDVFTLPVTGTYTITVDPRNQDTGSLTFLLTEVVAARRRQQARPSRALALSPPRVWESARNSRAPRTKERRLRCRPSTLGPSNASCGSCMAWAPRLPRARSRQPLSPRR